MMQVLINLQMLWNNLKQEQTKTKLVRLQSDEANTWNALN